MSMRSKVRRLLAKVITTTSISKLHWAMVLFLLWLAYQLGIHERGGAVGGLVFYLLGWLSQRFAGTTSGGALGLEPQVPAGASS